MNEILSLREACEKWNTIREREVDSVFSKRRKRKARDHDEISASRSSRTPGDDPFDCSEIRALSSEHGVVLDIVCEYSEKWRNLEKRRIHDKSKEMFYSETRFRLPHGFDIADPHKSELKHDHTDLVLSLDGSEPMTYDKALMDLFSSIPKLEDIDALNSVGGFRTLQSHIDAVKDTSAEHNYFVRCRKKQCHDMIPDPRLYTVKPGLVLEFWITEPVNGCAPFAHRAMATFPHNCTLLDVHRTIIELREQKGWSETKHLNGIFMIEQDVYYYGDDRFLRLVQKKMNQQLAGGNTDLEEESSQSNATTQSASDLRTTSFRYRKMSDVLVNDFKSCLGVRYGHLYGNDVETSVFVVDRLLEAYFLHENKPMLLDKFVL